MYVKFSGSKFNSLKQYHHVKIDREFKDDCRMWELFLTNINAVVQLFIDLSEHVVADRINFYTDSSANGKLGFGGIFQNNWFFWTVGTWIPGKFQPQH